MLLANHGALTIGTDLLGAYYKMETIEHFAKVSLVARMLGGERLLSREEVFRLQGLRGSYGIGAPAPICPDPAAPGQADCQVVQAPVAASGERLVPEDQLAQRRATDRLRGPIGPDEEIRLTYRELTALIEDAVRNLK
jgi:L-fuculose-phosphate aldolase